MSSQGGLEQRAGKVDSMLLAGLVECDAPKAEEARRRSDGPDVKQRRRSEDETSSPRRGATRSANEVTGQRRHSDKEKAGKSDSRTSTDSFRQLEQKYLGKVEIALAKVDEQIASAVARECQLLRSQMESLQREVHLLKDDGSQRSKSSLCPARRPTDTPTPRSEVRPEVLEAFWSALDEQKRGVEAQVTELQGWVADLQEGLEASQLEQRIQIVAMGMLVFEATGMSEQDKKVSMEALVAEEAALQERYRAFQEELEDSEDTYGRRADSKDSVDSETAMTPTRSIRTITSPPSLQQGIRLGNRRRQVERLQAESLAR